MRLDEQVSRRRNYRRGQGYVVLAALAWSTAGVLQRGLDVDIPTQIAGRSAFGFATVLLFIALTRGSRAVGTSFTKMGRFELAFAACSACATTGFIVALNYASVASVVFMFALTPMVAAGINRFGLGIHITRKTLFAMLIAAAGVSVMVGGPGGMRGVGLILSVIMTVAFALMVTIAQYKSDTTMAPAICLSHLVVVLVALPVASLMTIGATDFVLLAILGIVQMGLGTVFFTMGARLIPAVEVALITLLEIVLAPIWVWLVFSERPSTSVFLGGVIVLGAVTLQTLGMPRSGSPLPQKT
jgi:drug/metabolite transporter (DMT)-like permease